MIDKQVIRLVQEFPDNTTVRDSGVSVVLKHNNQTGRKVQVIMQLLEMEGLIDRGVGSN